MYIPRFKHNSKNVPILSRKDIDFYAEEFIKDFQPEVLISPVEINIELFVEDYLELVFDFQYLSCDSRYLGMTVFNDTKKVIVFDVEQNQADYISAKAGTIIIDNSLLDNSQIHRYRFTVAHECGHWIFHKPYYGYDPFQISLFELDNPFVQCRDVNKDYYINSNTQHWDDNKWMEWQADNFASSILMPKASVKKIVTEFDTKQETHNLIKTIVSVFNVSYDAAKYRLSDLGIIKRVVHKDYEQLTLI